MSRKLSPVARLVLAMDHCAIARGEAQWLNGYRSKADLAEQDRLHPKEMKWWCEVEKRERRFARLAQRLLQEARSVPKEGRN